MKMHLGLALAVVSVCGIHALPIQASLVITEVMSDSGHTGGDANGDWWELTNTGSASVDLTDFYWDDDGPSGNDGSLFPALSIAAGQSIVIVNESDSDAFVAAWGEGFTAISKDDFGGPEDFSGLSGGGDQIELWDADPNAGFANLVASVVFGEATEGFSFEWGTNGTSLELSVVGENGAYVAPGDGDGGDGSDVGSPGVAVVPEPSSVALFTTLALMSAAVVGLRRRLG